MTRAVRRKASSAAFAFGLVIMFAGAAAAQVVGGGIQGTVKDAQGAMLPGATVVVRNAGTGASYEQTTDQAGHFQVPALPPGEYEVRISLTGFRPLVNRGFHLTVGPIALLDASLHGGQVAEQIEVRADALAVNLTSGAVSGVVGDAGVRDLP